MKIISTILFVMCVLLGCTDQSVDLSAMRVWTYAEMSDDRVAQIWVDESTGGNGTFYLVADCGDTRSDPIRIGVDIAPQTLMTEGNIIIVNYVEKTASESVGVSAYFDLDDACALTAR